MNFLKSAVNCWDLKMLSKKTGNKKIKIKPQTKAQKDKAEQVFNKIMSRHAGLQTAISDFRNRHVHLPSDAPSEATVSGSPEFEVVKTENNFEIE